MQQKLSFDQETIIKIIKGAIIAATGTFALIILDSLKMVQVNNPFFASLLIWFIPTATNLVKEYFKGE